MEYSKSKTIDLIKKYFNCCTEMAETLLLSAEKNGEKDEFIRIVSVNDTNR